MSIDFSKIVQARTQRAWKTFEHDMWDCAGVHLERNDNHPAGRHYYISEGVQYPSVTTILDATGDTTALNKWQERVGEKEAAAIAAYASRQGTYVHELAEQYLLNTLDSQQLNEAVDVDIRKFNALFRLIQRSLNRIEKVHLLESRVVSHKHKYAGTIDCVGVLEGKLTLIDFKTYRRDRTVDQLQTAFAQTSLYTQAIKEMCEIDIEQIAVITAGMDYGTRIHTQLTADHLPGALERVARYHADNMNGSLIELC